MAATARGAVASPVERFGRVSAARDQTTLSSRRMWRADLMIQELYGHVVFGDTPDVLPHIQRDGINVVACPFPMNTAAMAYVDGLDLTWDGELMTGIRNRNPDAQSFNSIV